MQSAPSPPDRPIAPHPVLPKYYDRPETRRSFVDQIFDDTASDYDWIIRVMSFGSGTWYRADALGRAGLAAGMQVLDVAIGTGAVARGALKLVGPEGSVVGLDPSRGMLNETRRRLTLPLVQGMAEALPFASERFDFLSMGYALRHVADLGATFAEYHRVLRPGGVALILEISRPERRALHALMRLYLRRVVPLVARIGSRDVKNQRLMQYFWDTIESCVPPEAIVAALEGAGFAEVRRTVLFSCFSEYRAQRAPLSAPPGSAP
jgi:demethylmenaquinone methyltransferase/2-methoxy-6-polyprenyl-1,4-benzoquinol methylase